MLSILSLSPQMSFLVHPDKNPDDKERAQTAFEGGHGLLLDVLHLRVYVSEYMVIEVSVAVILEYSVIEVWGDIVSKIVPPCYLQMSTKRFFLPNFAKLCSYWLTT